MITEPNTWKNPNTHYFRSVKKQMVQTVDFIGKFNYWRNNEILLKKGYYYNAFACYNRINFKSNANGSVPNWNAGKCVGIIAHTMVGMHKVIKKLVLENNVALKDAIKILTINPANALGLDNKGIIGENKDADIIILDDE